MQEENLSIPIKGNNAGRKFSLFKSKASSLPVVKLHIMNLSIKIF